jgi:uncharacterized repeat protein (TIGR01451 family)
MASYTVQVNVNASASGTLTNTASVASSTTLINTGDDTVMEGTTVNQVADLSISKSDSPDPVATGQTLTYTVTVSNAGPSDATNVVVADTLPAGLGTPVTSGCAEDPSGGASCSLGAIAAGGMKQYTIMATVTAGPGSITNSVSVSSDATDLVPGNNSAMAMTTVINPPAMITTDPVALDVLGNTTLEVAQTQVATPSVFLASDLQTLAGVTDADPLTFSISGTTPPTNGMATITDSSTGEFTYTPNAGATSDTFDVDVFDGFSTVSFTVNITTAGSVWYVKNDHNSGTPNTGTGTSADPFTTLEDADGASDGPGGAGPSLAGDIIYVFRGDGTATNQDAGIKLRDMQK